MSKALTNVPLIPQTRKPFWQHNLPPCGLGAPQRTSATACNQLQIKKHNYPAFFLLPRLACNHCCTTKLHLLLRALHTLPLPVTAFVVLVKLLMLICPIGE